MNDIVIFEAESQQVAVRLEGETLWLSLQQLADLFGRNKSVISRHLKNIFYTSELERERAVAKNATVQKEGEREVIRQVEYFYLDAIISVGYRVKSTRLLLYYAETPLMVLAGNDLYARQIASYDV